MMMMMIMIYGDYDGDCGSGGGGDDDHNDPLNNYCNCLNIEARETDSFRVDLDRASFVRKKILKYMYFERTSE